MEPFLFCRDRQDEVFKFLAAYVEVTRRLAARHEAVLVSLQSQIDLLIGDIAPEKWSADMVHPYLWVHAWIAQKWLDATGL
ncbi:MAG: hypothetical protein A2Y76_12265 [Planctomycetes bacterium RBG_13_60_9]|nr:MAG: hypothetical protein A2Y76_12265 [Planctomycetes bacterium RBG_13_60_9]